MSPESAPEGASLDPVSTPAPEGIPASYASQSGPERATSRREHAVPCQACGWSRRRGDLSPKTMTYNNSALCDRHEKEQSR